MKRSAILIFAILASTCFIQAQQSRSKFGIRAGISTSNLDKESVSQNGLNLAIKDANYGYHLGLFFRAALGNNIYLQPELLFNSNSVDFQTEGLAGSIMDNVFKEKYQNLDIPLMLGLKLGPLRLEGGPVGHVFIASQSELDDINGYEKRFNDFNLGYQAGVGLDIWRFLVDVRYEGNFNDFGEHMRFMGEEVRFSQNPSRWVMTLGFAF